MDIPKNTHQAKVFKEKNCYSDIQMKTIKNYCEYLEKKHKVYCYRKIGVVYNSDGKKIPSGEKNNMLQDEINSNRGDGNTYSISIKYVPDLYCIDFDTKDLSNNKLFGLLKENQCIMTETKKGYHFYIYINNMIEYTDQQKIYIDPSCDIDLLKKNNVWETDNRNVKGKNFKIDWEDIKEYFNVDKMTKSKKKISTTPQKEKPQPIIKKTIEKTPKTHTDKEVKILLNRLGLNRYKYHDWVEIGMILHHYYDGDIEGLNMWNWWSKKDKSGYVNKDDLIKKYYGFKIDENSKSIGTLVHYALEDDPPKKEEKEEEEDEDKDLNPILEEFNKECVYITDTDEFICYIDKYDYWDFKKVNDARLYYSNRTYLNCKNEEKPIFNKWLSYHNRREVKKIEVNPNKDEKFIKEIEKINGKKIDVDCFNDWTGLNITYNDCKDTDVKIADPILNHIKDILCDGDEEGYKYVIKWCANMIQNKVKNRVALCFKSKEGSGKSLFISGYLGEIIGNKYYNSTADITDLLGSFNSNFAGKLLINLNEACWGGNTKDAGKVKGMITEPTITVKKKGIDAYVITDICNYIYDTNESYFAKIEPGSRRHFCNSCSDKYAGISSPEKKKYFDSISPTKNPDMVLAFARVLYEMDLSEFDSGEFKITKLQAEQIELSFNNVGHWWKNILMDSQIDNIEFNSEYHFGDKYIINEKSQMRGFTKTFIYDDYVKSTKSTYGSAMNQVLFWKELSKYTTYEAIKIRNNDKRYRCINFNKVCEMRNEFDEYCNFKNEWE